MSTAAREELQSIYRQQALSNRESNVVLDVGWKIKKTSYDRPYIEASCPACKNTMNTTYPFDAKGNVVVFRHCGRAEAPSEALLKEFLKHYRASQPRRVAEAPARVPAPRPNI